ncbi:MAG TPA: Glu/Leu/Phe/Val dehydrogenase [Arenicellales bacterium]|nr:Glu/Leu/Phe/Val dehydrogenase [Arenicellales bacterium]
MTDPIFRFCDDLGPKTMAYLHDPKANLRAILVVDNVAAGPSIGGVRMAPDVSLEECFRLARAMTYKNAAAGIPHGGGKSVIFADPASDVSAREKLIRAFANAIGPFTDYIAGPDMGTNEQAMAWVQDEIGRSVGLPRELGGIPLDEIGATGFGLATSAEVACEHTGRSLAGARVAIQGFGSVGRHAACFLSDKGAVIVGAADSTATVYRADGLDAAELAAFKADGGHFSDFAGSDKADREAVIGLDCDILIPAARPDVIREDNQDQVKAALIVPGANIGVTTKAEQLLYERGVLCLPDFISNAGGVICASVEYHGGSESQTFDVIASKISSNTREVLERSSAQGVVPREAAVEMAGERVRSAMTFRRRS